MSEPLAGSGPRPTAPVSRRERGRPRGGSGVFWAILLAGALPAAGVVWFLLQPEQRRDELLGTIPAGWAGRAAHAGIAFGALVLLARVALPAFHGASKGLEGALATMTARRGAARVLRLPLEALLRLLALLTRVLFAVDAALILAACLVLLLLVARIVKPDLLPSVLPMLGR